MHILIYGSLISYDFHVLKLNAICFVKLQRNFSRIKDQPASLFSLLIVCFAPILGTSDGTLAGMNNTSGGRCKTHNMKLKVTICTKGMHSDSLSIFKSDQFCCIFKAIFMMHSKSRNLQKRTEVDEIEWGGNASYGKKWTKNGR